MKISDQVIEEVDEQMTITSMRAPENRPTAASLFPPTSQPVDVPTTTRQDNDYMRTQSHARPSSDQPFTFPIGEDTDPIGYLSASAPENSHTMVGTPTGNAYDLLIEEFDMDSPPGSEQTLVGNRKSGAGDDRYEKKNHSTYLDRPNRFLARSVSAQQQPPTDNTAEGGNRPRSESTGENAHQSSDTKPL